MRPSEAGRHSRGSGRGHVDLICWTYWMMSPLRPGGGDFTIAQAPRTSKNVMLLGHRISGD
jgi:hypothetical protein